MNRVTDDTKKRRCFFDAEYLLGFDATQEFPGSDRPLYSTEIFTATANVRAYWLTGRVQPYALVGAGFMYAKTTPAGEAPPFAREFARFAWP